MNDLKGIIEDCNKSDLVSKKVIEKVIEIIGQKKWNDLQNETSDICTTMGELIITLKGITDLEEENEKLQLLLDVQNFLIEPKNKEKKEHLKQSGWVEITMPCSKEDARDCLTKQEGLCESTDGLCRIKINLSRLCKC
jgi:hypothetical protein